MSTISLLLQEVAKTQRRAQVLGFLTQDRAVPYESGAVNYMNVVSAGTEPWLIPGAAAYEFYSNAGRAVAHTWQNQVPLESLEKAVEYDPTGPIHFISPTPLLMIVFRNTSTFHRG